MNQIWFIADTHFGHKNIIGYENRPFASLEEMDAAMIRNWNNTVSPSDKVFILGDFAFAGSSRIKEITGCLNGYKILIWGNHDPVHPTSWWLDAGFQEFSLYPVILDGFFILSHEPMYVSTNMPYANIFGHVHSNPLYTDYSAQSFCVSVERIGYKPIEFEIIKKLIQVDYEKI